MCRLSNALKHHVSPAAAEKQCCGNRSRLEQHCRSRRVGLHRSMALALSSVQGRIRYLSARRVQRWQRCCPPLLLLQYGSRHRPPGSCSSLQVWERNAIRGLASRQSSRQPKRQRLHAGCCGGRTRRLAVRRNVGGSAQSGLRRRLLLHRLSNCRLHVLQQSCSSDNGSSGNGVWCRRRRRHGGPLEERDVQRWRRELLPPGSPSKLVLCQLG